VYLHPALFFVLLGVEPAFPTPLDDGTIVARSSGLRRGISHCGTCRVDSAGAFDNASPVGIAGINFGACTR
jgi:hypothetical protein